MKQENVKFTLEEIGVILGEAARRYYEAVNDPNSECMMVQKLYDAACEVYRRHYVDWSLNRWLDSDNDEDEPYVSSAAVTVLEIEHKEGGAGLLEWVIDMFYNRGEETDDDCE